MKHFKKLLLLAAVSPLWLNQAHAVPAEGEFLATQACPLYQSKNQKTNPGNQFTELDQKFQIIEILGKESSPNWVRVKTNSPQSPERWLEASCGKVVHLNTVNITQQEKQNQCEIANLQDHYVLALSWQATFCDITNNRNAECKALNKDRSDISHQQFTLHGLWPNKKSCSTKYGFCGSVKQQKSFCDYPKLALTKANRDALEEVMPSAEYGTCLQRHEYFKHGACMTEDPNEYFATSIRLMKQINESKFMTDFVQPNIGKKVTRREWESAWEQSFGVDSKFKVRLQCREDMISEIQIQLPMDLTSPLPELLKQAPRAQKGTCPAGFRIDTF